jgi:hypothetical protein
MTFARDLASFADSASQNLTFRNKIINGDFGIWQRGTSFTNNATGTFNTDRFKQFYDGTGATRIISQQTFTPGSAPAAPYESQYFLRFNQSVAGTSGTFNTLTQPIEDVRTFAGTTVTLSYWAKAAASLSLTIEADQGFGSGGSSTVTTSVVAGQTITTSWVRYSHTFSMPSVSGKTIGTSSFVNMSFKLPLNTTFTFDIWGVQVEAGPAATPFEVRPVGTELALCQRYYYKTYSQAVVPATTASYEGSRVINYNGTTIVRYSISYSTMRTAPTITVYNPETGSTASIRSDNSTNVSLGGPYNIGDGGAFVDTTPPSGQYGRFQFVASAEL